MNRKVEKYLLARYARTIKKVVIFVHIFHVNLTVCYPAGIGGTFAIDNFDCPHVSCAGQCGKTLNLNQAKTLCSCDKDCVMFGDCCRDFYDVCSDIQSPPSFTYNHGHVSCLKVPTNTVANKVSKTGLVPSSILN